MDVNENQNNKKNKEFFLLFIIIGLIFIIVVGLASGLFILFVKYLPKVKANSLNVSQEKVLKYNGLKKQKEPFLQSNRNVIKVENKSDIKNTKDIAKEIENKQLTVLQKKLHEEKNIQTKQNIELSSKNSKLDLALQEVKNNEVNLINEAINNLKLFPTNQQAFDAIKQIAIFHKNISLRIEAVSILQLFKTFDLMLVYDEILRTLDDEKFGGFFINFVSNSKIEGYVNILIKALTSKYADIRYRSIFILSKLKNPSHVPLFINIAKNDSEWKVRDMAIFALCSQNASEVIPILYELLKSNNSIEKMHGFSYLKYFDTNSDIHLKLLEYIDDPDIGKSVAIYINNK